MNLMFLLQSDVTSLLTEVTDSTALAPVVETVREWSHLSTSEILTTIGGDVARGGLKILLAILIYIVGAWVIRIVKRTLNRYFTRRKTDPSIAGFLNSFASVMLTILLVIGVISVLGFNTTSLAALLAAAGVAIGMALSGTFQNFAGGIMLLLFKPYKVGDFIEAQGYSGTVKSIQMTFTELTTPDNKLIVIPNGALSNGNINNYSAESLRRVDWSVTISYGDDVDKAKACMMNILTTDARVLQNPAPFVALSELGDSAIVMVGRAWAKGCDYWDLFFAVNEAIYKEFPKNGLNFPFPQMDVHISRD